MQRDRYGEIVFRLYFGLLYRDRIALGDPHPGNYLLCPDGRVCFLDFGLLRGVDAARVAAERAIALAVRDGDPEALKAALRAGGYLPASRADAVDADFAARVPDSTGINDHQHCGRQRSGHAKALQIWLFSAHFAAKSWCIAPQEVTEREGTSRPSEFPNRRARSGGTRRERTSPSR